MTADEITPWTATRATATLTAMPVKIPGGPVVKVNKQVWRGRIWRKVPGPRTGTVLWDTCPHNHLKRDAAQQCGEAAARRMNKMAAREHEPWPTGSTVRGRFGYLLRHGAYLDESKVSDRVYPLTGRCHPCGRPVTIAAKEGGWQHQEEL